ncbi:MAG: ATPase [Pseudomonadota bacterium]|nr:ATPase [Pseudomonadota bacterium]
MTFDWLTFGFQLVNIVVLLAILRHFLFRPLLRIIDARQAQTQAAMDEAAALRAGAAEAALAAKTALAQAEGVRRGALEQARIEAEAQRKSLLDAGRAAAAQILTEARAEAAQAAIRAGRDNLAHVRELAEAIARRAISALPDPPTIAGFARKLGDVLAELPRERREGLLVGGERQLVAPHALSPEEIETARAILRPLGVDDLGVAVDASLIAGLELRTRTGVVRNSLAHDLDRISQALNHDDAARI